MPNTLSLSIETPNGILFNEPVKSVHLRNELGDMEAFPGHAPLVASILFSKTRIRVNDEREETFLMRNGVITINADRVKILVENCVHSKEVDYETIRDYEKFVLSKLANPEALSKIQIKYLEEQKSSLERMIKIEKND